MSPAEIDARADFVDPDQLWRLSHWDQCTLSDERRKQLDAGVMLRRHAHHMRRLDALRAAGKSMLITPLSESSAAYKDVETPDDHRQMRERSRARAALCPETEQVCNVCPSEGTPCQAAHEVVAPPVPELTISTEHGPWIPSNYSAEEGEKYCQRCLMRHKFLGAKDCTPHIVYPTEATHTRPASEPVAGDNWVGEILAAWNQAHPRMDIYSKPGTLVVFDAMGGHDFEKKRAETVLKKRHAYEVSMIDVDSCSSAVRLKGVDGWFNTCLFAATPQPAVKQAEPVARDGWKHAPECAANIHQINAGICTCGLLAASPAQPRPQPLYPERVTWTIAEAHHGIAAWGPTE